jgi:hypothetical protein
MLLSPVNSRRLRLPFRLFQRRSEISFTGADRSFGSRYQEGRSKVRTILFAAASSFRSDGKELRQERRKAACSAATSCMGEVDASWSLVERQHTERRVRFPKRAEQRGCPWIRSEPRRRLLPFVRRSAPAPGSSPAILVRVGRHTRGCFRQRVEHCSSVRLTRFGVFDLLRPVPAELEHAPYRDS